ncbi:MAG: hypothetical protein ACRDP3_15610 [Streptomyces sp.]|uniref:hypothetical protein n=1 Tax=Streptomyces sp. TaxID=1931 RepID=UPI003D6B8C8B
MQGDMRVLYGILSRAQPDALVELLLPHLWAGGAHGRPANVCVDSCLTLKYAYGQLGIRAEVVLVDLVIREAHGAAVLHGTAEPSWNAEGTVFDGHCILHLPYSGRSADPTIEQFAVVREQGGGPVVGRIIAGSESLVPGGAFPPGTSVEIQRGDLRLLYTVSNSSVSEVIDEQSWIAAHAGAHYRAGVNLASLALEALRTPAVVGRARQVPYPRLWALLAAVGDAPQEPDDNRDARFLLPGAEGPRSLRLDEIPLPAATPGPYPRPSPV